MHIPRDCLVALLLASAATTHCGRWGYELLDEDNTTSGAGAPGSLDDSSASGGRAGSGGLASGTDAATSDGVTGGGATSGSGAGSAGGGVTGATGSGDTSTTTAGSNTAGTSSGANGGASASSSGAGGSTTSGGISTSTGGAGGISSVSTNTAIGGAGGSTSDSTTGTTSTTGGSSPGICVPDTTCSCGTWQGHDYRFCPIQASFSVAMADCASAGMQLIRVDSAEENAWLFSELVARGLLILGDRRVVYLGGSDQAVEGQWIWQDATLFWDGGPVGGLYTNWQTPPIAGGVADCLVMIDAGAGLWDARACNSGNATYACEGF